MAFSFGSPAPAPAQAPATAGGGGGGGGDFSFGGTASPAPAAPAAPAPAAAGGGFSFGGAAIPAQAAPAAAAPIGVGGGFSFGGTAAPSSAAAAAPVPPATAGGFSFGTAAAPAPSAAAGAGSSQQAMQPEKPKATVAIPPYSASFHNLTLQERVREALHRVSDAQATSSYRTGGGHARTADLDVQELVHLLRTDAAAAGEGGCGGGPVGHLLAKPSPLTFSAPDAGLRTRLKSHPYVLLQREGEVKVTEDGSGTVAAMTSEILEEILTLSDELRLTEVEAASLYVGAADPMVRSWLEGRLDRSFVGASVEAAAASDGPRPPSSGPQAQSSPGTAASASASVVADPLVPPRFGNNVLRAARELYFHERSCLLSTLSALVRARVEAAGTLIQDPDGAAAAQAILISTDQLLQAGLVGNLVALIRELTAKITDVGRKVAKGRVTRREAKKAGAAAVPVAPAPAPMFGGFAAPPASATAPAPTSPGNSLCDMDHVMLAFAYQSRQAAAECLFYLAYHTQLAAEEVGTMIDLTRDLTNGESHGAGLGCGLPLLDPIRDVPDIYTAQGAATEGSIPYGYSSYGQSSTSLAEKGPAKWKSELVRNLWDGAGGVSPLSSQDTPVAPGMPQLLQCVGSLVMAIICALDPCQVLMERTAHGPNAFGSVSVCALFTYTGLLPFFSFFWLTV